LSKKYADSCFDTTGGGGRQIVNSARSKRQEPELANSESCLSDIHIWSMHCHWGILTLDNIQTRKINLHALLRVIEVYSYVQGALCMHVYKTFLMFLMCHIGLYVSLVHNYAFSMHTQTQLIFTVITHTFIVTKN